MELGWGVLMLLVLAGALLWFWQDSLAARERANAAAIAACQRLNLQFLDGTVAFARLSLIRDGGRLKMRRTYVFDYTAHSIERSQGFVLLTGKHIESVGYAPGELLQPPAAAAAPATAHHEQNKVLDLTQWRAQHGTPAAGTQQREDRNP